MPELPDVVVYVERLTALLAGGVLQKARLGSPFVLRTVEPPLSALEGKRLLGASRIGKRIVLGFESELFLVIHLMISGRLRLKPAGEALQRKTGLAAFDFERGTLLFTEASPKKRASLHVVLGRPALEQFDRGGLEPLTSTPAEFRERMRAENRTLKRALTDPRLMSGIGNAYSDEILHAARLSPVKRTQSLSDAELERLHQAMRRVLKLWTSRLRKQTAGGFPDRVTAFHEQMAAHGRYGQACPVCQTRIQRIRYAANEVNYCPQCQTAGKLLADRALSRLLKADWPKSPEELDELIVRRSEPHA